MDTLITKKKGFPSWIIVMIVVAVAVAIVGGIVMARAGSAKQKAVNQLELARKYVSGLDYEQAIISYQAAISIDSKNVDALLELAALYVEVGEYDKAKDMLDQAVKVADDDQKTEVKKKADDIRARIEKDEVATMATPTPIPEPTDEIITPELTETPTAEPTPTHIPEYVNDYSWQRYAGNGETIFFGSYEQDNNTANGKEPLEWIVLSNSGGERYLLSKYVIDYRLYNEKREAVTWETCTLRRWLNEVFYEEAFSESEKKVIKTTLVKNADNPEYGTDGGNDTYDKVFLPSIVDMVTTRYGFISTYFDSNTDNMINRRCAPTKYAEAKGVWPPGYYLTADDQQACWWWLRSQGSGIYYAALVLNGGDVDYGGYAFDLKGYANPLSCGVRPALIISDTNTAATTTPTEKPTVVPEPTSLPENVIWIDDKNFPDPNFRDYVLNSVDLNGDGMLSEIEVGVVRGISVSGRDIKSLTGIEHFYALDTLHCNNNDLTSLDVSQNTKLQALYCERNRLSSLDIRYNTELRILQCSDNSLTNLDVSQNTSLLALSCDENQLESLDLSQNLGLQTLWCDDNQLADLNVSQNHYLISLSCQQNRLTSLDVTNNTELDLLQCGMNQLSTLDVSKNAVLRDLRCYQNQLTSIDVTNNIDLMELHCEANRLTSIDVTNNQALRALRCNNNELSTLDVSHNASLEVLSCSFNSLTTLDITNNRKVKILECNGNMLNDLDLSHNKALNEINCILNKLERLDVSNCDPGIVVHADDNVEIIR